ncbi:MAG: carboxylating nicotinate-nucleotide diphosphorylase [Oscillospiraceae bacterium]|nr:carboxylating nicotinate-nucleotide diphosphorylase [Oscillospiraceae bacterium]
MEFDHNIDEFILMALSEDIGTGDVTTNSCVPYASVSTGKFIAKQPGVICGMYVLSRVFRLLDMMRVRVVPQVEDGAFVNPGDIIAEISGPSRSILTGERTALNLLQHLSGITTKTAEAVKMVAGTNAKITDTRKILPGLRALDKYAVRCGGGSNHRFNLSDGVLIKDNHIAAAGGIAEAVSLARLHAPHTLKIEVETESLQQVAESLEAGADIIMLDNMSPEEMREAVKMIDGRALTEASGNIMGSRDLRTIAETGVDFISIGALTHSVTAFDISLKFK